MSGLLHMKTASIIWPRSHFSGCADDARRAVVGEHAVMLMLEMMSVLLEQACCNLYDALCQKTVGSSSQRPVRLRVADISPDAQMKPQDLLTSHASSIYMPLAKVSCHLHQ